MGLLNVGLSWNPRICRPLPPAREGKEALFFYAAGSFIARERWAVKGHWIWYSQTRNRSQLKPSSRLSWWGPSYWHLSGAAISSFLRRQRLMSWS